MEVIFISHSFRFFDMFDHDLCLNFVFGKNIFNKEGIHFLFSGSKNVSYSKWDHCSALSHYNRRFQNWVKSLCHQRLELQQIHTMQSKFSTPNVLFSDIKLNLPRSTKVYKWNILIESWTWKSINEGKWYSNSYHNNYRGA